jgi:Transposase DDE domain
MPNLSPPIPNPTQDTFDLFQRARTVFEEAYPNESLPGTWRNGNRAFSLHEYLCTFLLAIYRPVVSTMRGMCAATLVEEVRKKCGIPIINSTSFSDAQHSVAPKALLPFIIALSKEIQGMKKDKKAPDLPDSEHAALAMFILNVVDSTVFSALPCMLWARFGAGRGRKDGKISASVRLHVSFDPICMSMNKCVATAAKVDEKKEWKNILANLSESDKIAVEVGDRNFSSNYQTLAELNAARKNFAVRFKLGALFDVEEELPLSEEEKAEGIIRHAWVLVGKPPKPGHKPRYKRPRIRLIWIQREDKVILLGTNLEVDVAPALVICAMYKQRWQIEFFFWWVKHILKCNGHWLAQSENGATLQLYLAMILGLLLHLQTGRRPSRRQLELLQLYTMGLVGEHELKSRLIELARQADRDKLSAHKRWLKQKAAAEEARRQANAAKAAKVKTC